ncbi:MAG: FAD-dependent oxidoreductase, partial [Bacillota bacterium]|nr:FAD-dependent oxidoreductase [Bacillota bacterium]
ERAKRNNKIEYLLGYEVQSLEGDGLLQQLTVKNMETGELTTLEADEDDGMFGCFVFIGSIPETGIYKGQITLTERGYIPTDEDMRTNLPGVFAAGDLREKSVRQVVTAAADGCIAAMQAEKYLAELS